VSPLRGLPQGLPVGKKRPRTLPRERRRAALPLLGLTLRWRYVTAAIAIAISAVGAFYAVWRSPLFKIREIEVEGALSLSAGEAIELSSIRVGENLLGANLAQARERILSHPRVEDVSLRKLYPNRLKIRLKEAEALALFKAGRLYEVNSVGRVLPARGAESSYRIPMLAGIGPGADAASLARRAFQAASILKTASRLGVGDMVRLSEVNLSDPSYPVLVAAGGARIILAQERVDEGLIYLRSILNDMAYDGKLSYIDLRYEGSGAIGR